jgi:hypothetical protein
MEKNMNYKEEYEDDSDKNDYKAQKIMEAFLKFNEHFAYYIKNNDPELFKRASDYAKTFTEEDVHGIKLNYVKDEDDGKQED